MALVTLWALFIAVVYYAMPLPETVRQVLYILDGLIAVILFFDFLVQLVYAPNRLRYIVTLGWLDLLSALPGLPALRFLRTPHLMFTLHQVRHTVPTDARMAARQRLAESTLLVVVLVVMLVVTIGSIGVVLVEAPADAGNIKTGEDAVWWSIVTVATVGYGDRFPVTPLGRLIGVLMIVMGVSLFTVLTSYIATQFMTWRKNAGPSEIEVLRREMAQSFDDLHRATVVENTALREELSALRSLLGGQTNPSPQDRLD
jgi:voltage-gated potassium channel